MQPIPYVVIFNEQREVFSYVRTVNREAYGDVRLLGKHTIGLGENILEEDGPNYVMTCLDREVKQEEADFAGNCSDPVLVGNLFSRRRAVDEVHFGLVYAIHTDGDVRPDEASIGYTEWTGVEALCDGYKPENASEIETWSELLISHLPSIYRLSKGKN